MCIRDRQIASAADERPHGHPVVVRIFALVAVDEYEVEHAAQSGDVYKRQVPESLKKFGFTNVKLVPEMCIRDRSSTAWSGKIRASRT